MGIWIGDFSTRAVSVDMLSELLPVNPAWANISGRDWHKHLPAGLSVSPLHLPCSSQPKSMLSTEVRLHLWKCKSERITPLLQTLLWAPISLRGKAKVSTSSHRLWWQASCYLSKLASSSSSSLPYSLCSSHTGPVAVFWTSQTLGPVPMLPGMPSRYLLGQFSHFLTNEASPHHPIYYCNLATPYPLHFSAPQPAVHFCFSIAFIPL